MDLRKQPRFAVQLSTSFSGEKISGEGTVVNLSTEGCALITDSSLAVSSHITLKIDLGDDDSPLAIELASVRWSLEPRFGVEFIRIGPTDGERLRAFVNTLEVDLGTSP